MNKSKKKNEKWHAIMINTGKLNVKWIYKVWGNDVFINKWPLIKLYFLISILFNILLSILINKL